MIIGFGYKARSGKDMLADWLVSRHRWHRLAFADTLKKACKQIFGWPHWDLTGAQKEEVDLWWSDKLGREVTPRTLLQELGTDVLRKHFFEDLWIAALEYQIDRHYGNTNVVITDVRFPNEAEMIHRRGGVVVRVDRPGAPQVGGAAHASEMAMDSYTGWDHVLHNEGTKSEAYDGLVALLVSLGCDHRRRY